MRIIVPDNDKHSWTQGNLMVWRDTRSEFGEFVQATVYADDPDAMSNGRLFASRGTHPLSSVVTTAPLLVLVDEHGNELWMPACTCGYGGEGPGGTMTILAEEGFGAEAVDLVTTSAWLHVRKGEAPQYQRIDYGLQDRRNCNTLYREFCERILRTLPLPGTGRRRRRSLVTSRRG